MQHTQDSADLLHGQLAQELGNVISAARLHHLLLHQRGYTLHMTLTTKEHELDA